MLLFSDGNGRGRSVFAWMAVRVLSDATKSRCQSLHGVWSGVRKSYGQKNVKERRCRPRELLHEKKGQTYEKMRE